MVQILAYSPTNRGRLLVAGFIIHTTLFAAAPHRSADWGVAACVCIHALLCLCRVVELPALIVATAVCQGEAQNFKAARPNDPWPFTPRFRCGTVAKTSAHPGSDCATQRPSFVLPNHLSWTLHSQQSLSARVSQSTPPFHCAPKYRL